VWWNKKNGFPRGYVLGSCKYPLGKPFFLFHHTLQLLYLFGLLEYQKVIQKRKDPKQALMKV
ncbi:MAG TPA: hypothetical protein PLZ32_08005, partial [Saprospiraceae bacterium]|nr:hypothetical protein [Saprospiraceae bacterium]